MVDDLNKQTTTLSRLLVPLFVCLNTCGQLYCVCGNYAKLPLHTDNDVDIWAKNTSFVTQLIESICANLNYKMFLKNSNSTGSNLFFYSLEDKQYAFIHIDVLQECRWKSFLPLVKAITIEGQRKQYENFWVANETVDAAMHLMYPLSRFGKVTPKYYEDIIKEARNDDFWQIIQDGWGASFAKKVMPLIEKGMWAHVEKEFTRHKMKLFLYSLNKVRYTEIKSLILFVTSNIKRLIKPNGLFIAFIGPDGCGKTTIQNNLQPFFEKCFTKGKIKKFYWRPFLFPRIQALLLRNKRTVQTVDDNEDISARLELLHKVGVRKYFVHCIKLLYYWLDYILGRSKYQGAWSRGGIVCFDRYWGDLLVFPERFGISVPTWITKIFGFFVPQPDIVFYLHAAPEVLISRKPELPFTEIKRQTEQYSALCERYKNYYLINGDQPKEKVLADIIQTCLETMAQRYPQNL